MKTYRTCIADTYAMQDVLEYICQRIESLEEEAQRNVLCLKDNPEEDWRNDQISECTAKAQAYERIIDRLTKAK